MSNRPNLLVVGTGAGTVAAGNDVRIRRGKQVLNVASYAGFPTDATGDAMPAINAAMADLYAGKGGVLDIPPCAFPIKLASAWVVDPSLYAGNVSDARDSGIVIHLNGNTFAQTHTGWGLDVKTNYFLTGTAGDFGTRPVSIIGAGSTFIGNASAAGGVRLTDTIHPLISKVAFRSYTTGYGLQIAISSNDLSTWNEFGLAEDILTASCYRGIATRSANTLGSFLGWRFIGCKGEGRVNNSRLFDLQGGLWNSLFLGCGGFYNKSGSTGGVAFYLDGSFRNGTFVAPWTDTGPDSSGSNTGSVSNLTDIAFGANYTTQQNWQPKLVNTQSILLPPTWRTMLLVDGAIVTGDPANPSMAGNAREVLRAPRSYYVGGIGAADSNDGLTVATPLATVQAALNIIYRTLDCGSYGVIVQLADATYTTPVVVTGQPLGLGSGSLIIRGNPTTPGNVKITTSGSPAVLATNGAVVSVQGLTMAASSSVGLQADSASTVTILSGCQFGACGTSHIQATTASLVLGLGAYKITGAAPIHWNVANSVLQMGGVQVDATNLAIGNTFASVSDGGKVIINGTTFVTTGSTGSRFFVRNLGVIETYGSGQPSSNAAIFPGSASGYVDASSFGYYA